MTTNQTEQTFARDLLEAGFRDIVSVVPPGAPLSPISKLKPDQLGKVPGRRNKLGQWAGYDWQNHTCTDRDAAAWDAAGANIGLRAKFYPAVDIDCTDEEAVQTVRDAALAVLGQAPIRTGRAPKELLVYDCTEPFGRMRLWFKRNGVQHLIEILGDGQQYVVAGTHPGTGKAYTWADGRMPERAALTQISRDAAEEFLKRVADDLDLIGCEDIEREGSGSLSVDRTGIDQAQHLAPSFDALQKAVQALPNDNAFAPGRDDYLRVGYAIKAAGGEDAYELFEAWALKWEGNDRNAGNDAETVRGDWQRMKPPYEVGYEYLADMAQEHGGLNVAAEEFEVLAEEPPEEAGPAPAMFTEAALAARLVREHGREIRWCEGMGGWLVWNGSAWERDTKNRVLAWASEITNVAAVEVRAQGFQAAKEDKICERLGRVATRNNIAAYATSHIAIVATPEMFDADPMLLNTPAGIVDLHTGQVKASSSSLMVTRCASIGPGESSRAPTWHRFLDEATGGDYLLQAYLKRLAGYSLTGLTDEQMLAFLYGPGGNGKSVFAETLAAVMGTYANVAEASMFASSKGEQHPTALADLKGARLVTASETQEGRSWDEARVKSLTGGDTVKARFMHRDFFTYKPQFNLIMLGNHRPEIRTLDKAMRRRLHIVPFTISPERPDPKLKDKLLAEAPGILAWMIEGCIEWQMQGLQPPPAVISATEEYFIDQDPLSRWIEDCCVTGNGEKCNISDLYTSWSVWCGENGERTRTVKWLSGELKSRGYEQGRDNLGRRGFIGIGLLYASPGAEFSAMKTAAAH